MHAYNAQRYQMVMSQRAQSSSSSGPSAIAPTGGGATTAIGPTSGHIISPTAATGHPLGSSLRTSSSQSRVGHPSTASALAPNMATAPSNSNGIMSASHHNNYDDEHTGYERSLSSGMSRMGISSNNRVGAPPGFQPSSAPLGPSRPVSSPTNSGSNSAGGNRVIGAPPGFGGGNMVSNGSGRGALSYGMAPTTSPSAGPSITVGPPGFGRGSMRTGGQISRPSIPPPQQTIIHDDDRYNEYEREREQQHRDHHDHRHHDLRRDHHASVSVAARHHHDDDHDDYRRDIHDDRHDSHDGGSLFASFPAPTIINDRDRPFITSPSRPIVSQPQSSQQSRYAPSSPGLSFFSFGMTTPPRHTGPDSGNDPSLGRSPSDSSAAWASSPEVSPAMGPLPTHHGGGSSGGHQRQNSNNTDSSPQLSSTAWPTLSMASRSPALMNTSTSRGPSSTPGRSAVIAGSMPSPLTVPQSSMSASSNVPNLSLTGASPSSTKKVGPKRSAEDDRRDMRPGEDRRVAPPRPKQSRPLHTDVIRRMEVWIHKLLSSLMPRPSTFETRGWYFMSLNTLELLCAFAQLRLMMYRLAQGSSPKDCPEALAW
jgi:hypothetical protein